MTSKRSASSGGLGALDWIVLFAMGVTAAAVAAGLVVHSGIAPVPSLIAAAALYMVMAASYVTIVRSSAPAATSDGGRLAELEEALEIIDADLQRIDRVEEDLARVNHLSDRVEHIDRVLSEGGAGGALAAMPNSEQFASEFEEMHAKIENLRADLEVETRSQRERIANDLKGLESLMLKLSRDLTTRPSPTTAPLRVFEPEAEPEFEAEPEPELITLSSDDVSEATEPAGEEPDEQDEDRVQSVGFIETVEILEVEDAPQRPDLSALAEVAEVPEDFYRVEIAYADELPDAQQSPEPAAEEDTAEPLENGEDIAEAPAELSVDETPPDDRDSHRGTPPEDMAATVRQAVDGGRVDLYLQPIVTLPDRKLRYYEGLTRIRTTSEDILKPDAYLPASEKAGITPLVDNVLLVKSVQVLRRLPRDSKVKAIFCNISTQSLLDRDFFPELVEFMEENSSLSESLVFEVSQPAFRALSHSERASFDTLGALGYGFSLDHVTDIDIDFDGLRERFFRFVKIEANIFLNEMEQRGAVLPTSEMKAYIEDFDLKLIVEKVEDEQAVARLLDYGVDLAQGYLFGLPRLMSPALIRELENADAA